MSLVTEHKYIYKFENMNFHHEDTVRINHSNLTKNGLDRIFRTTLSIDSSLRNSGFMKAKRRFDWYSFKKHRPAILMMMRMRFSLMVGM